MFFPVRWGLTQAACLLLLVGLTGAPGCSHLGPTSPLNGNGNDLPFVAGPHMLVLSGSAISPVPGIGPCTPFAVPPEGTGVTTAVNLLREGNVWVARSISPEAGDLEFHFEPEPNNPYPVGVGVKGTVRGSARDGSAPPTSVRLTILGEGGSASARLDGTIVFPNSAFIYGRVYGAMTFVDSIGRTGSCPSVSWAMSRSVPVVG